ncbi:sigma-70 family RNA polymerase sigma factor [Flavobacteriaceae bacterium R38]|nr:sigma-70 family RNA polymerase sigma factor [Flavobacteriaceae bacterium R38]
MNKKQRIRDARLVVDYQSGNQKALSALVKLWHREFCRTSYWIVKDADVAKDIAQDSWKIIIEKIDSLREPKNFKPWALQIVYRKSIDYVKQKAKEQSEKERIFEENNLANSNNKSDEHDVQEKKKMILLRSIKLLPLQQQMVLQLFYVQEYSLNEMSEILGVSTGTVKSRLFHAREKLKSILKETKIG